MALFFRQTLTVAVKDLRSEVRTKEALNASISFSVVILLLFSFAFEPSSEETHQIGRRDLLDAARTDGTAGLRHANLLRNDRGQEHRREREPTVEAPDGSSRG